MTYCDAHALKKSLQFLCVEGVERARGATGRLVRKLLQFPARDDGRLA